MGVGHLLTVGRRVLVLSTVMNPTPYGSYYYSGNPSDWGNPYGAAIESAAPLATVESGRTYTISMSANTNVSPVVLDLLANGVILAPSSSPAPIADALMEGWFVHTKTYSAASLVGVVGEPLKIRVGWAVGANGPDQGHLDNVQLKTSEIPVPNGGFETLYKPGSTTITADTGAGWTQGVGPNADMEGGVATYSDATTGTNVDIPGWVNAPATGTPPNGGWAPPYGWPKGSGTIDRNNPTPYGSYYYSGNPSDWGNPYGAAIESAAPLATVESGRTYTISMSANTNVSPVVLDLLANGVILTPSSSPAPIADPLMEGWFVYTKTYAAASLVGVVGEPLKIRVGWAVGANGPDQGHLDNVQLNSLVLAQSTDCDITAFGPGAIIDQNANTIAWDLPYGTAVTALAPTYTLSFGATCVPASGATKDFTSPQTYTVTAQDGTTTKAYTVTVTLAPPSAACDMLTFGANVAGSAAVITAGTVDWYLPYGTAVAALAPAYTLSLGATCVPTSGTTKNFTSPQTYTVTAQDGTTTQGYTVTARVPTESALLWMGGGGGLWDLSSYNWLGQTTSASLVFTNGYSVIFDATGGGGTINIPSAVLPLTTTVTNDSPVNYSSAEAPSLRVR